MKTPPCLLVGQPHSCRSRSGRWRYPSILIGGVVVALCSVVSLALGGDGPRLSPIIYPRPEPALRFSHPRHEQVPCRRCHQGISRSLAPRDSHLPREAVCRSCHKETRSDWTIKQSPAAGCKTCHQGYSGAGVPRQLVYPAANLRFSHQLHLGKGTSCSDCHIFVRPDRELPSMSRCRRCHEKRGASTRCVVCHLSEKDGRIKTRYAEGVLKPRGSLISDNHTPLFSKQHSAVARQKKEHCETCHQTSSCLRCHNATLRPMSIHSGDYVNLHGFDARLNQKRCTSCHRYQTFCLSCHQRLGVAAESPRGGFKPNTPLSFHAAGFSSYPPGPTHHQHAARRNISSCVSCHREKTCIRCHGTAQLGKGGFSPHPPGFRGSAKCQAHSQKNGRVCFKCHAPGDRHLSCE